MTIIKEERFLRLANIAFRLLTLFCKFILMFFLAKYFSPSEVGLYGLLVFTIAYCTYPLSLEFSSYSSRELIRAEKSHQREILKNQTVLHLILYLFFLPLYLLIFQFDFLPKEFLYYFFLLLVLEHSNQELQRLLIASSYQLRAGIALFFRQGFWSGGAVLLMFYYPHLRTLSFLLGTWLLGGVVSLIISSSVFWQKPISIWVSGVNWTWIKRGVSVALPFFLSSLCLTSISTFDKYCFRFLLGEDALGAYIFFSGLAAALLSFFEAGIFSFAFPQIVSVSHQNNELLLKKILLKMMWQVLLCTILFVVGATIVMSPVLTLIGKEIYFDYLPLFYWFVLWILILGLGCIPQYALYAKDRDRPIILSHLTSVFVFLISVLVFSQMSLLYSVPFALCVASLFVLLWKVVAYKDYQRISGIKH